MRKIFKFLVFLFIISIIITVSFYIFLKHNIKSKQVAVLVYHNIVYDDSFIKDGEYDSITIAEFSNQMTYLYDNGYKTLTAEEFYKWKTGEIDIPDKSVLITFDDGCYSFTNYAVPLLEKLGFNAICFVIGQNTSDTTPEYNPQTISYIGRDELQNPNYNNVEFGSHTFGMHHLSENGIPYVKTFSKDELQEDVNNFNNNIFPAEYLAYPYYTYTSDFIEVLKNNNYKLAFCGEEEMATRNVNNYKIPRI